MEIVGHIPALQSLRAMVAVAKTRSFTKAAAELGLTQTAVSHQIAQLERWLGTRLFIRDRAGIELTAEGETSIPRIAEALAALHQAVEAARPGFKGQTLRVSTTPEFATQWLTPRLGAFCSRHSEIDISVTIEYRRVQLDVGEVDVAIWLTGSLPEPDAVRLTADRELVVCSPAVMRTLPKRQAMRAAPLLRYEGARHTVLDWQRWHGQIASLKDIREDDEASRAPFDFDAGPCYPTFSDMLSAARGGAGLALVRTSLVADDLATGRLVQCFTETIMSDLQYHLVTAPAQRRRADVMAFRTWVLDAMRRLGGG